MRGVEVGRSGGRLVLELELIEILELPESMLVDGSDGFGHVSEDVWVPEI